MQNRPRKKALLQFSNRTKGILWWIVIGISSMITFYFLVTDSLGIGKEYHLNLSAGNARGSRHELAYKLSKIVAKNNIILQINPTEGSKDAINKVSKGELDLALVQGGLTPISNVRQVAALQFEALHLLVKKEHYSKDLRSLIGKRLNLSTKGSGTNILAKKVLQFAGIKTSDYIEQNLSYDEIESLAKTTKYSELPDGFFFVSSLRSLQVLHLVEQWNYQLVDLPFGKAYAMENFAIKEVVIPKYTYCVNPPIPSEDLNTIGTQLLLVSNEKTPIPAIKTILETIYNSDFGRKSNISNLDESNFQGITEYPLHEGAIMFKNRNQSAITSEFIDNLESFRSFVFSLAIAVFLFWRWYVSRRGIGLDIYLRKLGRIEEKAQDLIYKNTISLEEINKLYKQLLQIKHDALIKVTTGKVREDAMFTAFLTNVSDVRNMLNELKNSLNNKK